MTERRSAQTRRTIPGWTHYLNAPDTPLTLDEFMARCLLDIRENLLAARFATEHLEGMVGTLDTVLDQRDPLYHHFSERRAGRQLMALKDGQPGGADG